MNTSIDPRPALKSQYRAGLHTLRAVIEKTPEELWSNPADGMRPVLAGRLPHPLLHPLLPAPKPGRLHPLGPASKRGQLHRQPPPRRRPPAPPLRTLLPRRPPRLLPPRRRGHRPPRRRPRPDRPPVRLPLVHHVHPRTPTPHPPPPATPRRHPLLPPPPDHRDGDQMGGEWVNLSKPAGTWYVRSDEATMANRKSSYCGLAPGRDAVALLDVATGTAMADPRPRTARLRCITKPVAHSRTW